MTGLEKKIKVNMLKDKIKMSFSKKENCVFESRIGVLIKDKRLKNVAKYRLFTEIQIGVFC